jgi:hypothetical protein
MPDDLNARLSQIEASGKARFGSDWDTSVEALKRAAPNGLSAADMQLLVGQVDPAAAIMLAGRHQLMNEASDGNVQSEATYRRLRQKERREFAEGRGRVFRE